MSENRKEVKTCHQCGLEAIDDCETRNIHIPADEISRPCCYCIRNPEKAELKTLFRADFYDQQWFRESDHTPSISDPDPHERTLLQTLHEIIQKEYARLPVPREVKNIAK